MHISQHLEHPAPRSPHTIAPPHMSPAPHEPRPSRDRLGLGCMGHAVGVTRHPLRTYYVPTAPTSHTPQTRTPHMTIIGLPKPKIETAVLLAMAAVVAALCVGACTLHGVGVPGGGHCQGSKDKSRGGADKKKEKKGYGKLTPEESSPCPLNADERGRMQVGRLACEVGYR